MNTYERDLEDGTLQIVQFESDPGKSTPQWRLVGSKPVEEPKKCCGKAKRKRK